jgi:polyphenol oxidase
VAKPFIFGRENIMEHIDGNMFFKKSGLVCFHSLKMHGNMKDKNNRRKFLQEQCPDHFLATMAEIAHGGAIGRVHNQNGGTFPGVDGLITNEPRRLIGVTFADCYPVIYYDCQNEAIGIAHCSYKSLKAQLCRNVMRKMMTLLGANAASTEIYIGPGICQEHYEFGREAPDFFEDYPGCFESNETGSYQVDLKEIIRQQLIKEGVREKNINYSGICTAESSSYFSARWDRKDPSDPIEACVYYVGLR